MTLTRLLPPATAEDYRRAGVGPVIVRHCAGKPGEPSIRD
jgi:hypothetical protein